MTRTFWRRPLLWALAGLALILLLLALLFQPVFSSTPLEESARDEAVDVVAMAGPASVERTEDTSLAASESVEEMDAETLPGLVADVPSSDTCIACHTNQVLLEQLAEEPQEVKSELNEGEG